MSIPKIIHYCWLGGNPKPESVQKCIASWRKYCPDYEIKEWNESNLNISMNAYTKQAYEAKAWGFVPDYLRLWIVYTYGGIYLDTDVQIIKNFDPLLQNAAFAGFERDTADKEYGAFVNFGQGFGAEAGNPIIYEHMCLYEKLHYQNSDGTYNRVASPHYTTQVLEAHGLNRKKNEIQKLDGITVYSDDYFCPKSFATGFVKKSCNTYSIHQFDGSWYSDEEQEMRRKWEKEAKKDYWIHLPNRIARRILGNKRTEQLKVFFKK